MSRIDVLEASLVKKQAAFDAALSAHFNDVKRANGQPLNDKRNGAATMLRWEKQNEALRNKERGLEKTRAAIERERAAILRANSVEFPECITELISSGVLTVWRKFPNFLFIKGAGKARIKFKNGNLFASHYKSLSPEECAIFRDVVTGLHNKMMETS